MTPTELLADVYARNLGMLKMTLGDFSDAEMLVRPAPAANHAAWQLGHLIVAETNMTNMVTPGAIPDPPAGFKEKFSKATQKSDNPTDFPTRQELLAQYEQTRAATIRWVKSLTPEDMARPGPERLRQLAPTVGHFALLVSEHVTMHIGQFQVIRRKLGKPVLF